MARGAAGENERKEEREGTRWEHVSHTEIVNYSFVLRRVGESSGRETAAGRGREYRGGDGWRKKTVSRGTGENTTRMHTREWERERERCRGARRDAGERTRRCISCFIGPSRPMLVTEVGWGRLCGGGGLCARGGKTKNEDEVNDIHAGYRILPSRAPSAATIFSPSLFFLPPPSRSVSRALRLSLSSLELSLVDTPTTSTYFT